MKKEHEFKGYSRADGVHWYVDEKEVAIIDEVNREIQWLVPKAKLSEDVISTIRGKLPNPAGKWIVEARRNRLSATQGNITIFVNDKPVATYNDEMQLDGNGQYVSKWSDDNIGALVCSTFWHRYDFIYHYSNAVKKVFYPDWDATSAVAELEQEISHQENKYLICEKLLNVLQLTRAGADIENLEYDGVNEIVRIEAEKWHKDVNVMADSGIALIRDVCKKL